MIENTESYWHKTAAPMGYPSLVADIEVDTIIIGGGITGVTCAYSLAQNGIKTVLIEAGEICGGTTGSTTGKATIQHGLIYKRIAVEYGRESAKLYSKAQTDAVEFIKDAVKKESIECQLAINTSYIYASREEDRERVQKEYELAVNIGIDAQFKRSERFPDKNHCMMGIHNQAVIHAVRYVQALAKAAQKNGAEIFCNSKAVKVEEGDIVTVTCENGIVVKAKHLIMATQYPIYDGMGFYFTRLFPKRDYGIAVETEREWPDDSYINVCEPTRSIRTHIENDQRVLIVVGEGHSTARGKDNMALHYENLINFANSIAGVKREIANWSAQDYKTPDDIPYIGRIAKDSNIFIAAGFGKWGISNGTLGGMMISQIIVQGKSQYEELFSPLRKDIATSTENFVSENIGSIGELIKSKFEKCEGIENIKPKEGRVIKFKGNKAGIYVDEYGNAIILDITCTHLKTELNFNSAEKTWDCPAHGGRFSVDGTLIEGPPKNPLKVLFKGKYSELFEVMEK